MERKLPDYLFVASDGDMYDTRVKGWHVLPPLRSKYRCSHREIDTVAQLKATLRNGKYTDYGCYPLYFLANDGESLSFEAVRAEFRQVAYAIQNRLNDGWRVVACDVNYEDSEMRCAHTGERIESAYCEEEEVDM